MINIGVGLALLSVLIAGIAQMILKKAADANKSKGGIGKFVNCGVISGYAIMLLASLLNVFALKYMELKIMPVIDAISYIYVPILSYVLLKEKITKKVILGAVFIIIGIVFFSIK